MFQNTEPWLSRADGKSDKWTKGSQPSRHLTVLQHHTRDKSSKFSGHKEEFLLMNERKRK